MLRLNTIPAHEGANSARKRLGRGAGSGLGPRAGKGDKGQKARKSGNVRPGFEGGQTPLYRRVPKQGFTNFTSIVYAEVKIADLVSKCGDSVLELDVAGMRELGLVKGVFDRVVVMGKGELPKGLTVKAHRFTAGAKESFEKSGANAVVIPYSPNA